ncbi:hypothetical protein [Nocardia vinacea]|uniref:hypothetical protein n=1 Tax=Nocardia vinacea TaxID=96468 RepID=UPI001FDEBF3C|nr:hypothetical protein [Nocardia vinacea]
MRHGQLRHNLVDPRGGRSQTIDRLLPAPCITDITSAAPVRIVCQGRLPLGFRVEQVHQQPKPFRGDRLRMLHRIGQLSEPINCPAQLLEALQICTHRRA